MDGKLWIGICAEIHDQWKEMPFWVLVDNREQIPGAIRCLQGELREFQGPYENDVTFAFVMRTRNTQWLSGRMKGDLFFDDIYPYSWCMDGPFDEEPRENNLFDTYYPDEWSRLYGGK